MSRGSRQSYERCSCLRLMTDIHRKANVRERRIIIRIGRNRSDKRALES
jgi:hypothetical protein